MSPIVLRLLVSFTIGSIPFAVISMLGTGIDIRKAGSGNPGFNNVLRFSKGRAVVALIGDMGKGYLAVWLVYRQFHLPGGVMLVLYPAWATAALAYFSVARISFGKLKWREAGTCASLTTWLLFTLLVFFFLGRQAGTWSLIMTLLLTWRHKANLRRIFGAQERLTVDRQQVTVHSRQTVD
jgi:glycerol-3-phosphate acyltransferase PlsY